MKLVFMGASKFGLKCFKKLFDLKNINIRGVVTTAKQFSVKYEKGTKQNTINNLIYDEISQLCVSKNIPLNVVTGKMNNKILIDTLKEWAPDFILVVGWYHIIGDEILKIPHKGIAGLHASLLPLYRGGAPLVWALINGESETGITFFYFDNGIDTGDIIAKKKVEITVDDTIRTLYEKVEVAGIELIENYLPLIDNGTAPRIKQVIDETNKVYSQRNPDDGVIDWQLNPKDIYNFVRAQTHPYPGAFTYYNGQRIYIWECKVFNNNYYRLARFGEIISKVDSGNQKGILVYSNDNKIQVLITCAGYGTEEFREDALLDRFECGNSFTNY